MKKGAVAVLVIIIAGLSFLAGGRYGSGKGSGSTAEREVLYYVDPMNPGFRSEEPGTAPCGMPLEPVYADTGDGNSAGAMGVSMSAGAVRVNQARQQLIGLRVEPAEVNPMTWSLRLYGKIVPDETRLYRVNAATDSWVRELSDVTTGSLVARDQLLGEVLAPAFYNAQVTYLVAMDNLDRIQRSLSGQTRPNQADIADNQIRVAVQALQNLGITDAQIEELANTRQARPYLDVRSPVNGIVLSRNLTLYEWFRAGSEFYRIADLSRVWVYADVYEDEVMHLRPGMEVKVVHKQMGKTFDARIGQVLPLFDPVAKTLKVRIDVDSPGYDLRPDMFVDVDIPITLPPALHLPADAVLDTGTTNLVYVEMGNNVFEPRRVETGWRLGRRIEITGGLMPGEKVVISGNFLIDSESRMKTAGPDTQEERTRDPVCGMEVDEDRAWIMDRTAEYGGQTFYFCMDSCKETFEKEPEKYARRFLPKNKDNGIQPASRQTAANWTDLLEPVKRGRAIKRSGKFPGQKMGRTIGRPRGSGEVVDWDGPGDGSRRDWQKGWGKFPGAKYLGIKDKAKAAPSNPKAKDAQGAVSKKVAEEEQGGTDAASAQPSSAPAPEMKDETRKPPTSGEPAPAVIR